VRPRRAATRSQIACSAHGSRRCRAREDFIAGCRFPPARTLIALATQAAQAGILIAPPGALQQVDRGTLGIRLCLGHPATDEILENALSELKRILESAEAFSFV
jgi:DNA-binding transcriptional MocR family regulator